MKMRKLLILFGAPGSGKSEACKQLEKLSEGNIIIVKKQTTRPKRVTDGSDIECVDKISNENDFRYSQYGFDYGFSSKNIWQAFLLNKSVAVIVNDIRTIKQLNKSFGSLSQNIYIHSNIERDKIQSIAKLRYPNMSNEFLVKDIEKRIEKIKSIHRKYISNTYLFDSSVINIYNENSIESIKELNIQLAQIYNKRPEERNMYNSTARILIIAGGSFAGKDELVRALIQIEPSKVIAYQKGTTRPKTSIDNNELCHLKKLNDNYDITYLKNGYKYGLSSNKIWSVLSEKKIVLIVLSELEAIKKVKAEFDNICSVIYLHSNIDFDELEHAKKTLNKVEFKNREKSIDELRRSYIENINLFDHVLLNTSESEDLYDQAFNILDYYLGNNT